MQELSMLTNKPLVSVITPTYNQAQFIAETIESVLTQDYPNLEYIILDGMSTDDTVEVIKQYSEDTRLKWISESDKGMADAINKGISQASGEYLTWINSDDVYTSPNVISEIIDFFESHSDTDIVYGDAMYTDIHGQAIGKNQTGTYFNLRDTFSYLNSVPQPGTIWHRRVTDKIGGLRLDLNYALDADLWIRAYLAGFTLLYFAGVRATYRLHDDSKTMTGELKSRGERARIFDEYLENSQHKALLKPIERFVRANFAFMLAKYHHRQGNIAEARQQATKMLRYLPLHKRSIAFILLWFDTYLGTSLYLLTQQTWIKTKRDDS